MEFQSNCNRLHLHVIDPMSADRPTKTIAVDLGRKATKQTNKDV